MRKVIVTSFISLDGYVAGVDGDVMALPFDPSFDNYNLDRIRSADTLLLGSTTYQQLMNFWVPLADDPTATALQREIGRLTATPPSWSSQTRSIPTPSESARQPWSGDSTPRPDSLPFGQPRAKTFCVSVAV